MDSPLQIPEPAIITLEGKHQEIAISPHQEPIFILLFLPDSSILILRFLNEEI